MTSDVDQRPPVSGRVKWFDPVKGFGFVVSDQGGSDILLHANVLRDFGQGTVANGAVIVVEVIETSRGQHATAVLSITPPDTPGARLEDIENLDPALLAQASFEPARVKWFDGGKGFGFAQVWGCRKDVFLHSEVLRRSGLADLEQGQAVSLRIIKGARGLIAIELRAWDAVPLHIATDRPNPGS